MGCSCLCGKKEQNKEEQLLDFSRIQELTQTIKTNTRYIRLIRYLQSYIKGLLIRKKYGIVLKSRQIFETSLSFTVIQITSEIVCFHLKIRMHY
jgi:hypothetical protein